MSSNRRFYTCTIVAVFAALLLQGCGADPEKKDKDFFTSGNRDADQRAEQRMAKTSQLRGERNSDSGNKPSYADVKKTLFDRLGGEAGITAIVDDFVPRALADPRVNWERKGVNRSAFSLKWNRSVEWNASEENVARLKKHLAQFLALATGGPTTYEGKGMKQAHADLQISNAEFDAAVGDLKATLDKINIATPEQKELLSIVESTRPQIVAER